MKKYLYNLVFAALILFSTTEVLASNEVYYTNRGNIAMTENEYNNLLELGFTEKQIELMDNTTFEENKDIEATLISTNKRYYRASTMIRNGIRYHSTVEITKEEAEEIKKQAQNPTRTSGSFYDGLIGDSALEVADYITAIGNTYMRFKTDATWLVPPTERYNDILGIGFESAKAQFATTVVFKESWEKSDLTFGNTTVCSPVEQSTGGSAVFKLPTGSMLYITSYVYFNVMKQPGVGTITDLTIGSEYAHATSNISTSNILGHYSVNYGNGILLDSTLAPYFYESGVATAYFVGTW